MRKEKRQSEEERERASKKGGGDTAVCLGVKLDVSALSICQQDSCS